MNVRQYVQLIGFVTLGSVLAIGALGAQVGDAATYYTATNGNDANPGTEASPFRTINRGVKALKPGDKLYSKSGTYAESLQNSIPGGSSWSAPVTVAAFPGATVTLRPAVSGQNIIYLAGSSKRYIIIDGLKLDGANTSAMGIRIADSGGTNASNIHVLNVEVFNTRSNGISSHGLSPNITFTRMKVHDTGLGGTGHGFYVSGDNITVEDSIIYDNQKCGIQMYSSSGGVDNKVFRRNVVYNNGLCPNCDNSCKHGLFVGSGNGALVYNNLFYKGKGTGVTISGGAQNTKVYHNTVWNNGNYGIQINGGNPTVRNNIVYQNANGNVANLGGSPTLSNNLTSNPLFLDPTANNFKLQAASPAINTGVTLSEVKDDLVKVPRPQGSYYDIGAYEYTGSTTNTSVSTPTNLQIIEAN